MWKAWVINSIILGYSSYINLNVDNHKYMFRPIDITKYPYKINKYKILDSRLSKNYTIKYVLLLLFVIFLNINQPSFLNKINLFIVTLFVLIVPYRKYIHLDNS